MARANLGKSIGTTSWLTTFTAGAKLPLHRQLYESIRDGILKGRLTKGSQVPSSRILMKDLGVSRNTVLSALEQLVAEGYLKQHQEEAQHRRGSISGQRTPPCAQP